MELLSIKKEVEENDVDLINEDSLEIKILEGDNNEVWVIKEDSLEIKILEENNNEVLEYW